MAEKMQIHLQTRGDSGDSCGQAVVPRDASISTWAENYPITETEPLASGQEGYIVRFRDLRFQQPGHPNQLAFFRSNGRTGSQLESSRRISRLAPREKMEKVRAEAAPGVTNSLSDLHGCFPATSAITILPRPRDNSL